MPLIQEPKPKPYKPVTPIAEGRFKTLAAQIANKQQGNSYRALGPASAFDGTRSPAYGSAPPTQRSWRIADIAPRSDARAAAQTVRASTVPLQYPGFPYVQNQYGVPGIQNPPFYQVPTPPNAVNYEKAIADTPEENRETARNVLNAYRQFLGREADEPGYFAHLHRALAEKMSWEQIANMLRESEEGQRYQAMRDVGLQIDPQYAALQRAYEQYMSDTDAQRAYLDEARRSQLGKLGLDYENFVADLARAVAEQRSQGESLMNRRGIWHSGITDKYMQDLALKEDMALARQQAEMARAMGDLERAYALGLGDLARQVALYGSQYTGRLGELGQRREALISQLLEKNLERREQEAWQKKLFDWEQQKFYTQLAQQAALARGYGGGGGYRGGYGYGGGYGGGGVSGGDSFGGGAFTQILKDLVGSKTTPENAASILTQAYAGARPGLNLHGMTQEQLGNMLGLLANSPGLLEQMMHEQGWRPPALDKNRSSIGPAR